MRAHGVDRTRAVRLWGVALVAAAATLGLPALALAHLERPSYWPDPAPDTSVSPAAGGEVPEARSFRSAVTGKGPGKVRVVCKGKTRGKKKKRGKKSIKLLRRSVRSARTEGFQLRPSQPTTVVSRKEGKRLKRKNRKLARKCKFKSIQEAVTRSSNNDRVVVMPGRYTEPESRAQPKNDPRCADLTQSDTSGASTPSYRYQVTCPHDQNLIYVQGRELAGPPPSPPLGNRHGLPDEGPCVRCNLQIEGSGVKPEDVIMDAGTDYASDSPRAKPGDYAKDVVMRVDRADGFVGRNFLMRGALEHGFYSEEVDGILLDRTKFFWNRDYGHLSFTTDHNVIQNCEGFGSGDAAVYPGAAPETGEQADKSFYPDAPRINTVVRDCDLHHSVLAYSGSMGNSVRITRNHVYATVGGITTDTISAQGHPGFPADSVQIDHNLIYSNNFNLYAENPPVDPIVGVLPVGTGIIFAGHNNGRVHDNWIFDNWRSGAMLFSLFDLVTMPEPEGNVNPGGSCSVDLLATTSCGNRYFDNHMGVAPPGFRMHAEANRMGNPTGGTGGVLPNGADFWWEEFPGNTGNCWFRNTGTDGTAGSVTPGAGLPPDNLPSDCGASVGLGDVVKQLELINCFLNREEGVPVPCDWDQSPPRPGTAAARAAERESAREARVAAESEEADRVRAILERVDAGR